MLVPRSSWTDRAAGDFAGDLSRAHPTWTWLRQVHGAEVVVVTEPGEHAGVEADAAVTTAPGCPLVVRTADCAPVILSGRHSVGVVHAGWRGLVAGVVERAVEALTDLGDPPVVARIGPCIRPGCYEFTGPELDTVADRYGPGVRATTTWGTTALDVPAAVRAALAPYDLRPDDRSGCTACDQRWFSHRARADAERFATVAWLEPVG